MAYSAKKKFGWSRNDLKPYDGGITKKDTALDDDVQLRSLYVRRDVINANDIRKWAKSQGFNVTMPASQMHVTVVYSKTPINWLHVGADRWHEDDEGHITVNPGGPRVVEKFGDAIVLAFANSLLTYRHLDAIEAGASYDFDEYTPHVTFTYTMPEGMDLDKVIPYRGKIVLGPEIFEEIKESFDPKTITEDAKPKEQKL